MSKVFVFIWTKYVDDYKLRGQSPSRTTVKIFKDKRSAYDYGYEKEKEYVKDVEYWFDNDEERSLYYDKEGNVKDDMSHDLFELCVKGEFVPKSVEWYVQKMDIISNTKRNKTK